MLTFLFSLFMFFVIFEVKFLLNTLNIPNIVNIVVNAIFNDKQKSYQYLYQKNEEILIKFNDNIKSTWITDQICLEKFIPYQKLHLKTNLKIIFCFYTKNSLNNHFYSRDWN